jgi:hypothetical protein
MSTISIAETLKLFGKWAKATEFENFVSTKRKITLRHAHNLVKKAVANREILRVQLPNGTVLYGLPEFGPTEPISVVEGKFIDSQVQYRYGRPKIDFGITQSIYDPKTQSFLPPLFKFHFPKVGFDMFNLNDYPIKVRVKIRMILGDRSLGLIPDPKGHYNGEAEMGFEPKPDGLTNGNFTVSEECAQSNDELTLEVRVTVTDPDNREHELLPKSWTYMRNVNDWYYEPKLFTDR